MMHRRNSRKLNFQAFETPERSGPVAKKMTSKYIPENTESPKIRIFSWCFEMHVTTPQVQDAHAITLLVRESIVKSQVDGERLSPAHKETWLLNKTAGNFAKWITCPALVSRISKRNETITGFTMMKNTGELMMLYVHPDYQRLGAGSLLLQDIEDLASLTLACKHITLKSSRSAIPFYLSRGYTLEQLHDSAGGIPCALFKKTLSDT